MTMPYHKFRKFFIGLLWPMVIIIFSLTCSIWRHLLFGLLVGQITWGTCSFLAILMLWLCTSLFFRNIIMAFLCSQQERTQGNVQMEVLKKFNFCRSPWTLQDKSSLIFSSTIEIFVRPPNYHPTILLFKRSQH